MYWKLEEYTDELGINWIIYNYYEIIDAINVKAPYYNGLTKTYVFPMTKQLVVKARIFDKEELFLEWYHQNKCL